MINLKTERLIKILLILSCPMFTILLSNRYEPKHILIGAVLSFVIFTYIAIKKIKIKEINKNELLIALFFSLYMIKKLLIYCTNNIELIKIILNKTISVGLNEDSLSKLLGITSIPIATFFWYFIINKVLKHAKKFLKKLSNTEKKYFNIILIIGIIISISITTMTTAFSKPFHGEKLKIYDVIYTSDSGALVYENTYLNVSFEENDIRQPLFGVFSLPFSVPAKIISELCFFFPDNYAYEILMTIIQFCLLSVTTIMLSRMMNLDEKNKKYLYLLFSCSFPYILFSILLEQYVICLFYLVLTFYLYNKYPYRINYMYIGAVGTMLTSGIIFPTITKFQNIRQWITNCFKCFLAFVSVFIISGQFPQLLSGVNKLNHLVNNFAGEITFSNKLCQFTNFIKGIFIATPGHKTTVLNQPSYQLLEMKTLSIIGIIILFICIISYWFNKKEKIAQISILWVLFSIVILLFIGWGTVENGLILYSLYFAWAYLILYFLFLKKILKKDKLFKISIIFSCIIMLYFNINEFIEILKFALKYY